MGLTKNATGVSVVKDLFSSFKKNDSDITVCLSGNPNVGKSSVFNALTGLHQHTGNWTGKTVETAVGSFNYNGRRIILIDTPGTYSLSPQSKEEEVAKDFILNGDAKVNVTVCDATALERNLNLILQIIAKKPNTILCLNFADEIKKRGIKIDTEKLSALLKIPVIKISARKNQGLNILCDEIIKSADIGNIKPIASLDININELASEIYHSCVMSTKNPRAKDIKIDKILTGKITAFPFMLLLLALTFWITIKGANLPSEFLQRLLFSLEDKLYIFLNEIGVPLVINELLIHGIFRVVAWIVAVMLPPMAIFFPLFTLLEDSGYLPRIAFCLDRCFKKCNACGKQSLTMCMGFGCNAAGIIGCRIIDSPRERLIAILTNAFVPCNGRFPLLISIITMFLITGIASSFISALILTTFILLGIFMTLAISFLLSKTLLRGVPSSFTLELPPYRRPEIVKTLTRSVLDRTLFVLGRAVISAIPAGLIIWLCANITIADTALLNIISSCLDPFAKCLGLDGVILFAFILALPANEIVIPIIIMAYMGNTALADISDLTVLKELFIENGWSTLTAINTMLFSLFHWPCMTSLLTIRKETGSFKWSVIAFILPTLTGMLLCFITNLIYGLIV